MKNWQRPDVQGTLLQQSLLAEQSWPYAAQEVVPPVPLAVPPVAVVPPAPAVPPEPGGGVGGSQVPCVDPGTVAQLVPLQQSAVVVQAPPSGTQATLPQTNGGSPAGFGTHGMSQQSALDAQAVPGGGGPFAVQS